MNAQRHDWISDSVLLAAIGTLGGIAAALWLWGGLAGVLFGSGWPRVGVSQLLGVLIRLPTVFPRLPAAFPRLLPWERSR